MSIQPVRLPLLLIGPRGPTKKAVPKFYPYPTPKNKSHHVVIKPGLPVIPLSNSFQGLNEFQVATGETFTLKPPPMHSFEDILPEFSPNDLHPINR